MHAIRRKIFTSFPLLAESHHHSIGRGVVYAEAVDGPRAPFGVPVRNPLLNLRGMSLRDRILPVPVVFLRFAFSPQLYFLIDALGYPQLEQVCF